MEVSFQPDCGLEIATVKDLAAFFRVDRTIVPGVMITMAVPKRGQGYPWLRIWGALGIDMGTVGDLDPLRTLLMELKDVATILEESAKTTRRRSDGKHRDTSIAAHIDLGPRKRLFFPAEIQSWILGEPVPFERKQETLSFIPDKVQKNGSSRKSENAVRKTKPSSVSAAALFMARPQPN